MCETVNSLYTDSQSILGLQKTNKGHSLTLENMTKNIKSVTDTANDNKAKLNAVCSNKLLWSGTYYMTSTHRITLAGKISAQTNGIVLVFTNYTDGKANNWDFHCFVVPKYLVGKHNGVGHRFNMVSGLLSSFCTKYLYISDSAISGHDNNIKSGTASSGVKYKNSDFVLRYVIGF